MHRRSTSSTERYQRAVVYHLVSLATKFYQEQIHGMCWYTRKKEEKEKEKIRRGKRKENTQKETKEKKRKKAKQTSAEGAGRVPRGEGCCLLVSSWWTNIKTTQKKEVVCLWWSTKEVKMLCPTRFVVDATENSTVVWPRIWVTKGREQEKYVGRR